MTALTDVVRARSKDVLGGQYRAEVAAAIGSFASNEWWTRIQLADRLRDRGVPDSCLNKELRTFVEWELVQRHDRRTDNNEFQYRTAGFAAFWDAARLLAEPHLPTTAHPTMRSIADASVDGGRLPA